MMMIIIIIIIILLFNRIHTMGLTNDDIVSTIYGTYPWSYVTQINSVTLSQVITVKHSK